MRRSASALLCALLVCAGARPASSSDDTFANALALGRVAATDDRPKVALEDFQLAFRAAGGNATRERIARFAIARTLLWLGDYDRARDAYDELLASDLDASDREIALDGAVRSRAYADRPQAAYRLGALTDSYADPALVVALANAARDAGWSDRARELRDTNRATLASVVPGTRVAREALDLAQNQARDAAPSASLERNDVRDSDAFRTATTALTFASPADRRARATLDLQNVAITAPSYALDARVVRAEVGSRVGDALDLSIAATHAQYGAWQPTLLAGTLAFAPSDDVRIVAFGEDTVVETVAAIDGRVRARQLGADIRFRPSSALAFDASSYRTHFSDGNLRAGLAGSVAYRIAPELGLGLEARVRAFSDRFSGGLTYFSPARYAQEQLVLTERHRLGTWRLEASAGIGREHIAASPLSTTSLFGLSASGPIAGPLRAEFGISTTNSALESASGYRQLRSHIGLGYAL